MKKNGIGEDNMSKKNFFDVDEIVFIILLTIIGVVNFTLGIENTEKDIKINELENEIKQQYELIDSLK